MVETEQIVNSGPSQVGADLADPAAVVSAGTATGGFAVIADLLARMIQFALTMGLVLALSGTLCAGLFMTARQFSRASRSSRQAVQSSRSIQAMSNQLRSIARDPETSRQREQFRREIETIGRQVDQQLKALTTQMPGLLDAIKHRINEPQPAVVPQTDESPASPRVPTRQ